MILSEAMIVDDRHDSAWEYSMNTISIGASEPIGPLEETVGWMHIMDARFHGIRADVGPMTFEAHGPRQAWLHEFQVRNSFFVLS
jgi:hypothetical protein